MKTPVLIIITLMSSISHASINLINSRANPVKNCSFIKDVPTYTRPYINISRSIEVEDYNQDSIIDDNDIQITLNTANTRYLQTGKIHSVNLPRSNITFYLKKPLLIKSGVILEGNGGKITPDLDNFIGDSLLQIKEFSSDTGIHDLKFVNNYKLKIATIIIKDSAKRITIYDNHFQDESANGTNKINEKGHGTNASMILLEQKVGKVFIDGNFFLHISTGIFLHGHFIHSVNITHNTFSKWRQRAIYVKAANGKLTSNIRISHNRINPPKRGTVRQAISFHPSSNQRLNFDGIFINYNSVYNHDEPHIWEYRYNSLGKKFRYTMFNSASPDVISLTHANKFQIVGNCIFNSGEVGITVTGRSRNGIIAANYIKNSDTSAIAIGGTLRQENTVFNINVLLNTVINASRNRNNSVPAWARSAIGFTNSRNIYHNNNLIIENNPRFNENGDTETLVTAFYSRKSSAILSGKKNKLHALSHVKLQDSFE